jgi:formylglycine-generating enzyme required for sulfatase activity
MCRVAISLALLLLSQCAIGADLPDGKGYTNSIGMKLVRIEAGEFLMGQGAAPPKNRAEWTERDWDEAPAHRVKITKPFFIGIHEVTNAQFEQFDPEHKKLRGSDGVSKGDDEPVTFVTWQRAVDFCAWLSKKDGKLYRLPTEAEWEYCCRAGTMTLYSTGDTISAEQANIGKTKDNKPQTALPVGSFKSNPWGLYDMHGNVAEWCHDWYGPYDAGEQSDPVGRADGEARVVRGWNFLPTTLPNTKYLRSANRSGLLPEDANRATGFRVVLGEMPKTKPLPAVMQPCQQDVKQTPPPKNGPDPAKPFFIDFKKVGKGPTMPSDSWGPIFNHHNHFGAVCVCPNGDVLAAWYTTVQEPGRECSQAVSRLRAGSDKWDPVCSFLTIPDVNCHAPVLFTDGKRIYHFFTQSLLGWDNSSNSMRYSDDNGATWSKPRIILPRTDPDALSQPCSCIKTKDGAIVLACDGDLHKDERFLVSKDDGKTWKVAKGDMRKSIGGKYVIHPAIFERADGSILTYLRGPHPMPVEVTKDLGDSFTVEETKFPGISGGMKAAVLKLHSGAVLLCSIDRTKELVGGGTFAALSLDDGKTWPHIKKVEGAGGYMALAQAPNGVIFLNGTQLGVVAFNEAWVKAK